MLAATLSVAASSGAQVPLTVDTNFRFFYTPAIIDYWDSVLTWNWGPHISDVILRNNGEVMLLGGNVMPLNQIPWAGNHSLIVDAEGQPEYFMGSFGGGQLIEVPLTNQYFNPGVSKRFNYDSSLDFSFGMASIYLQNRAINSWQIFPDRSGIVAGTYQLRADTPRDIVLIKMDQWGEWDSTWTPRRAAGWGEPYGQMLFPLSNGQYLFNGSWTSYEGRPSGTLVRIEADGTLDTTFYFSSWKSNIAVIREQPDGKVILGGRIWMNGIEDTLHLVRVNVDGSLDPSFNNFLDFRSGTHAYSSMACGVGVLEPLEDGRVIVGGHFTTIDGATRGCIACVDYSGNLLDCWQEGGLHPIGYSQSGTAYFNLIGIRCIANGACYLYGQYKGLSDANGYHADQVLISKLYMPGVGIAEQSNVQSALRLWPNPGAGILYIDWGGRPIWELEVRDALGRVAMKRTSVLDNNPIDVSSLATGTYTVLARNKQGERAVTKWVKP